MRLTEENRGFRSRFTRVWALDFFGKDAKVT